MRLGIFYPSWFGAGGYHDWTVRCWGVYGLHDRSFARWRSFTAAFDDWFDKVMLQHDDPDPGEDWFGFEQRCEWMGEDLYA